MIIKKFNQLNESYSDLKNFKSDEKILKVTFNGSFYVPLKDIENTEVYNKYINMYDEDIDTARFYAIEQYICDTGDVANHYNYKLMNGAGIFIDNEEEYDNAIKYNI